MNNDVVQCGDLKFKKLYNRQQIDEQVDRIANEVDQHFDEILAKDPNARFVILGILNGAFMFVSELVRRLQTRVFLEFIKVKSYKGTQSGDVQIISEVNKDLINGSYLLVVDDICDSGKTLAQLGIIFKDEYQTKETKFATMIIRPDKEHVRKPDYVGLSCSEFIVGFGLDYAQYGRQYPQIYQKFDD